MFDDETAAARQQYPEGEPAEESNGGAQVPEEVLADAQGMEVEVDMFPDTPPPDKPLPQPLAHRARITGITAESNAEGTRWLKVSYTSLDNGSDDSLVIFPPLSYVNNPLVDPATLSTETPINPNTNRPGLSDRQKYAQTVRNSGKTRADGSKIPGDGSIETIIRFAKEQGHHVSLTNVPNTFDKVAEYMNALCTGTEVVALQRPQGGDGEFSDRLRTARFMDFADADKEKALKQYRRLWRQ